MSTSTTDTDTNTDEVTGTDDPAHSIELPLAVVVNRVTKDHRFKVSSYFNDKEVAAIVLEAREEDEEMPTGDVEARLPFAETTAGVTVPATAYRGPTGDVITGTVRSGDLYLGTGYERGEIVTLAVIAVGDEVSGVDTNPYTPDDADGDLGGLRVRLPRVFIERQLDASGRLFVGPNNRGEKIDVEVFLTPNSAAPRRTIPATLSDGVLTPAWDADEMGTEHVHDQVKTQNAYVTVGNKHAGKRVGAAYPNMTVPDPTARALNPK